MSIMEQKMDELIDGSRLLENQFKFNEWLYEACKIKAEDPHNIFPYVNLTDARLSFLDGMSAEEYSKTIQL